MVRNPGVDEGDGINLTGVPLSQESLQLYLPTLIARGVNVVGATAQLVSGDGNLDTEDAVLILQHIIGLTTFSASQLTLNSQPVNPQQAKPFSTPSVIQKPHVLIRIDMDPSAIG